MADNENANGMPVHPVLNQGGRGMAAPRIYTVREAMAECGVNDDDNFDEKSSAQRIASDIFSDDFSTCMDKSHKELDSDFKSYSDLTQNQGQIRISPGVKKNIKAFVQWSRDEYRLGRNPQYGIFNSHQTQALMRRYNTHKQFSEKSSDMADAARPTKFPSTMRWDDWAPTFLNYLRLIPGRDGVPLNYVCRDSEEADPTPNIDFIDDYVMMAPINEGEAYTIDAAEVHTLIVKFITGNETAEMKIKAIEGKRDGRLDWAALKEHYEGVGIHSFGIIEANSILANLY